MPSWKAWVQRPSGPGSAITNGREPRSCLGRVFNFRSGRMHTILLLPSVAAIQPNLELKTRLKQLLGSLPLVIALPAL